MPSKAAPRDLSNVHCVRRTKDKGKKTIFKKKYIHKKSVLVKVTKITEPVRHS